MSVDAADVNFRLFEVKVRARLEVERAWRLTARCSSVAARLP